LFSLFLAKILRKNEGNPFRESSRSFKQAAALIDEAKKCCGNATELKGLAITPRTHKAA
jgi:hypothetical protein